MTSPIAASNRQGIVLPPWMMTREQEKEQRRILAGRYFLVKIAGNGDVWRCRHCKGKHRYLTLMCVEQPFSGLTRGLFAYYKTVGMHGAQAYLSPVERARYAALSKMFRPLDGAPDIATAHPQFARHVNTAERDADVGAFTFVATEPSSTALGLVEPVSRDKAARLVARINARGIKPPLVVEGLNDGD
jgi:hypothetical protein